jgi:hypothetical protein
MGRMIVYVKLILNFFAKNCFVSVAQHYKAVLLMLVTKISLDL